MTFETLDYVAEAERISTAFDVKGECEFIGSDYDTMKLRQNNITQIELNTRDNLFLYCVYEKQLGRTFSIYSKSENDSVELAQITVDWLRGLPYEPVSEAIDTIHAYTLAKGIFYLDLLTPEVEAAMQVTISNHQKLEWVLEYNARFKP